MLNFWKARKQKIELEKISTPTEQTLRQWSNSEWIEYQAWLCRHGFLTLHAWQTLRTKAQQWQNAPLISIITPIYNTLPHYLYECVYSVQTQAYPKWELCLVNDGSTQEETLNCLTELADNDQRLRVHHFNENQGICAATNQAIQMAKGQYIAFLDHDDRLAPNALFLMAEAIKQQPEIDVLYSDRDMLSPRGLRFMHLFKPAWSPETLLSGNYLFHLMVYRRELIEKVGGIRADYEGSQDYDLILRVADLNPTVKHIPKVLYHWRQHEQSVAMAHNAKEYAYDAGIRALEDTLKRRNLNGKVEENKQLWRGNYRIHFNSMPTSDYLVIHLNNKNHYTEQINHAFQNNDCQYLVILGKHVQPIDDNTINELISWLQIPEVGMTTGKIVDIHQQLLHAGLVQRPSGIPLMLYKHFPKDTAGYMATTMIIRNVSTPHPECCAIKRKTWEKLQGLDKKFDTLYALFDFSLRSLQQNYRIVYQPFAYFSATKLINFDVYKEEEKNLFTERWQDWLQQGDPYYNPHLTLELNDMGLDLGH